MRADFDPEADDIAQDDSEGSEDFNDDSNIDAARDHYAEVGKSKLRKPKAAPLGPQYRGARIERDDLEGHEDDENDPFSKGFDEESSSDEDDTIEFGEETDSQDDELEGSDEEMDDGTSETDLSDDEEDPELRAQLDKENQAEAKKAMVQEEKEAASSISLASKVDAEKGRAVKKQRTAFDALLNTRMKLQKSLVSVNTIVDIPEEQLEEQRQDGQQAIEAAEAAAFALWSSLNQFRDDLLAVKTGEKRKAPTFTEDTPTEELWSHMQKQEKRSIPDRTTTLQKWYEKAPGQATSTDRNKINNTARATIIDSINEQLSNPDRLVKRAQTARSCAPVQVSKKISEDPKIYDDADFYGLLLKDLLEQKSQDSVAVSNIDISFQMRREAKTKKNVDTKASKGRKLRYTVHEKLQNFMPPEDRSSWGDRQTDELFGSLFGQRLGLGEEQEKPDEEMDDEVDPQEASLMLFRN